MSVSTNSAQRLCALVRKQSGKFLGEIRSLMNLWRRGFVLTSSSSARPVLQSPPLYTCSDIFLARLWWTHLPTSSWLSCPSVTHLWDITSWSPIFIPANFLPRWVKKSDDVFRSGSWSRLSGAWTLATPFFFLFHFQLLVYSNQMKLRKCAYKVFVST